MPRKLKAGIGTADAHQMPVPHSSHQAMQAFALNGPKPATSGASQACVTEGKKGRDTSEA